MAYISTGGWNTGRKSQSTGKKGAAIGGQAVTAVKLCIDCVSRPANYPSKEPGADVPPCTLRPNLTVFEVRAACQNGKDWLKRP